ncbi:MAG: sulfite exporter TauE/SafE family protein [bacterium]
MFGNFLLFFLIIAFAGFTQGFSGFGSTMVALPLVISFIDIKTAVPLLCLLALYINAYLMLKLHRHIPWKKTLVLLISAIPGIFLGVYALKNVPSSYLLFFLGSTVILASLYEIFGRPVKKETSPSWEYLVGFIAGIFRGSLNIDGPIIVTYFALQPWSKNLTKAIFCSFFFLSGVSAVIFYASMELITSSVLHYFLVGMPALVLGTWLGHFCYQKTSETFYKRVITYLLLLLGVFTIYKALV